MSKALALVLLVLLMFSSLVMVGCTFAQAAPEFTISYADHSYDIPASTSTDPYTGNIVQNPPQHVENRTLQFTIKNSHHPSHGYLVYVIRMKGHFSDNWSRISRDRAALDSAFTVLLFSSPSFGEEGNLYHRGTSFYFPFEGKVDFQVKAQVWGEVMAPMTETNPLPGSVTTLFSESSWSDTQTLIIEESQTPSPEPTSTPYEEPLQTELFGPILVVVAFGAVFAFGLVLLYRIKRK